MFFFLYIFAKNGAAEVRLRDAVYPYNHADWYVEEVLEFADRYVEVNKSEAASRGKSDFVAMLLEYDWTIIVKNLKGAWFLAPSSYFVGVEQIYHATGSLPP